MKSLNFKDFSFHDDELLDELKLKTIFGGDPPLGLGDCRDDCYSDGDCPGSQVCRCLSVNACSEINNPLTRCLFPNDNP